MGWFGSPLSIRVYMGGPPGPFPFKYIWGWGGPGDPIFGPQTLPPLDFGGTLHRNWGPPKTLVKMGGLFLEFSEFFLKWKNDPPKNHFFDKNSRFFSAPNPKKHTYKQVFGDFWRFFEKWDLPSFNSMKFFQKNHFFRSKFCQKKRTPKKHTVKPFFGGPKLGELIFGNFRFFHFCLFCTKITKNPKKRVSHPLFRPHV